MKHYTIMGFKTLESFQFFPSVPSWCISNEYMAGKSTASHCLISSLQDPWFHQMYLQQFSETLELSDVARIVSQYTVDIVIAHVELHNKLQINAQFVPQ